MTSALPLAALLIAGASLILSTFFASRSLSRSASSDWVGQLEKRVTECEKNRDELRGEVAKLRDRELDLLTRLVRIEEKRENQN